MSRCGYRTRVLLLPPAFCSTLREVPKRDYKAVWEYRDEKNISFVRCDWHGSGRDESRTGTDRRRASTGSSSPSPKSAFRHLDPGQLARAWKRLRHLDDVRRIEGTNSQGSVDADFQLSRNQVGSVASWRYSDQNERGAAYYCDAQEEAMTFTELLRNVGLFGAAVMCCLIALSIFSVAVIVDKHRRFRLAVRQSEIFKPMYTKFLHGGEVQELIEAVQQHQNSHVAQVVSAGILEYDGVRQAGGDPVASLELVTSALRDSISETLIQLKRGLGFLATIGSTAPFIGLFGTVVGIINAFRSIAATGSGGMSVVSGGIAEALVTTALGIFVAIPAVVAFNHFTGKIETFHVQMNRASSQLVNHLFKVPQVMDRELRDPQLVEQKVKVAMEAKAYAAR